MYITISIYAVIVYVYGIYFITMVNLYNSTSNFTYFKQNYGWLKCTDISKFAQNYVGLKLELVLVLWLGFKSKFCSQTSLKCNKIIKHSFLKNGFLPIQYVLCTSKYIVLEVHSFI
jgi:hypothetical protein